MEPKNDSLGCVLIVDDMAINARLLAGILKIAGYSTVTASSGPEALAILGVAISEGEAEMIRAGSPGISEVGGEPETGQAATDQDVSEQCALADTAECQEPDVVLLDVMMPGLDGFETCRRIKEAPHTSWMPVVMVTALHEATDRVAALESGADDFLTKPVDEVEVVARVKSLVRIKRQRDELARAHEALQQAENMRDSLATMLVHDLRTPLTTLVTPLEMMASGQIGDFDESQMEIVNICARSAYSLLDLVNQLLDIHKLENGHMELEKSTVEALELVVGALEQVAPATVDRMLSFETEIQSDLPALNADRELIQRVLANLLGNAIKFSPAGGRISVAARRDDKPGGAAQVVFSVTDHGPGIELESQSRIFDKFGTAGLRQNRRQVSSGLGLTFCKLAVEAHDGTIWVDSKPGAGSTFSFTIPG